MKLVSYIKKIVILLTLIGCMGFSTSTQKQPTLPVPDQSINFEYDHDKQLIKLTQAVVNKHNVDWNFAYAVVKTAKMYEHDDFPKAQDILSIISIESQFDPKAKKAGNIGLAQINYKTWKHQVDKHQLYTIDGSIKQCANILSDYYDQTGNAKGAVMAYNVGITAYKNGTRNQSYYKKFILASTVYNNSI